MSIKAIADKGRELEIDTPSHDARGAIDTVDEARAALAALEPGEGFLVADGDLYSRRRLEYIGQVGRGIGIEARVGYGFLFGHGSQIHLNARLVFRSGVLLHGPGIIPFAFNVAELRAFSAGLNYTVGGTIYRNAGIDFNLLTSASFLVGYYVDCGDQSLSLGSSSSPSPTCQFEGRPLAAGGYLLGGQFGGGAQVALGNFISFAVHGGIQGAYANIGGVEGNSLGGYAMLGLGGGF